VIVILNCCLLVKAVINWTHCSCSQIRADFLERAGFPPWWSRGQNPVHP